MRSNHHNGLDTLCAVSCGSCRALQKLRDMLSLRVSFASVAIHKFLGESLKICHIGLSCHTERSEVFIKSKRVLIFLCGYFAFAQNDKQTLVILSKVR